jgi:hypothetical protein
MPSRGRRRYCLLVTADAEPSPTTDSPSPAAQPPRRSHRVRNTLLIVFAFLAVLGVAAGGVLFYLYDKATAIDRSTPQVVVDQFLDAALKQRDVTRLSLFVCDSWPAAQAISEVDPPPSEDASISWTNTVTNIDGHSANVTLMVRFAFLVGRQLIHDVQSWTLKLENTNGWRVCSLTKNGSLNP